MKNKRYRNGNSSFQCYLKLIGRSYECGVICAGKIIFLGNFTRKAEAMQWWGLMNREIRNFAKRYKVGKTYPASWFRKFLGLHLNDKYFYFVNRFVHLHFRHAHTVYGQHMRQYKRMNRRWTSQEKKVYLRAA